MIVQAFKVLLKNDKSILALQVLNPYGTFIYLANYLLPDITFFVNILARYNCALVGRLRNSVKNTRFYFHGTTNMRLFAFKIRISHLNNYVNVGYF